MKNLKTPFTDYIPEITTLRGIAILAVLINHLNKDFLPGGFFGVDLFFVISGYVVSIALAKLKSQNFQNFIIDFYSNRLKRILPALFISIFFTTIFYILFIPPSWLSEPIPKTGIFGVFGFANIALMQDGNGYFSPVADMNPFTNLWSLGVEEQFYFLFPLIFYLWIRKFRLEKLNSLNISNYLLTIISIISLIYSIKHKGALDDRDYYSLFSRFWEIGIGAILYQVHNFYNCSLFNIKNKTKKSIKYNYNFLFFAVILLFFSFIYLGINSAPFPGSIPVVISTLIFIDFFRFKEEDILPKSISFILKPIDFLGRISYSTYLYHWPVIVLMKWTVGIETTFDYFLATFISISLGYFSFVFIETPFRKISSKTLFKKLSIFIVSIFSALGLSSSINYVYKNQNIFSLTKAANIQKWRSWETTILEQANLPKFDFSGKSLFVIGDSHSAAYGGMNEFLQKTSNLKYYIYAINPCHIGSITEPLNPVECRSKLEEVLNYIESNSKQGDIVFLASLRIPRYRDSWQKIALNDDQLLEYFNSEVSREKRIKGEEELIFYIEKFSRMGLNILLDYPKPVFPSPPFRCVDWFNKNNPICKEGMTISKKSYDKFAKPIIKIMNRTANNYKNVFIWDPTKIICDQDLCDSQKNGDILYFDGDHINAVGNKYFYIDYSSKLKEIFNNKF